MMNNQDTLPAFKHEDQHKEIKSKPVAPSSSVPNFIKWKNPENRLLVHFESCSGIASKRPLLQIDADQFVVIETAGKRIIVQPGISSILRGKMDTKTIIWLLKTGYDPTEFLSNLETNLYFVDTKDHRLGGNIELSIFDNTINLVIPFFLTIRMGVEQVKGLFDQAYEWKSDEAINEKLQNTAIEAVKEILKPEIINCFANYVEVTDLEIQRILYATLTPHFLTDLANQINRELCWKGISLSKRIEINHRYISIERIIHEPDEEEAAIEDPKATLEGDFGFFHYIIPLTGGAVITGFKGEISEAVIPEEICNQPVIAIGEEAFAQCEGLVSVVISSSVQTVGKRAFIDCHSLSKIVFPTQLTRIDDWAFARCNALNSLVFGDNMANLGDHCFFQCISLKSIQFLDNVKVIGKFAFSGCSSLVSLNLPNKIERIEEEAFSDCTQLTRVYLPPNLSFIGEKAFSRCSPQLGISVSIGSYAENWCKANGISYLMPFRWGKQGSTIVLLQYTGSETEVIVPDKVLGMPVVAIADRAFFGNTSIRKITLPSGLKLISSYAFSRCVHLEKIQIPSTVAKIDLAAFSGCSQLKEIEIPGNVLRIPNSMMENCQSLKRVVLSQGVQHIGAKSFLNCSSLETVELPESLLKIGVMAFCRCISLKEARIPEGVNEIEPSAFSNCSSLKQVELPQSLVYIGSDVFNECSNELVCYVQSNLLAEKWCRMQRIKISKGTLSHSKENSQANKVCPRCGRRLSPLSGKCRNCD